MKDHLAHLGQTICQKREKKDVRGKKEEGFEVFILTIVGRGRFGVGRSAMGEGRRNESASTS